MLTKSTERLRAVRISGWHTENDAVQHAIVTLRGGGVVLYPTDTLYGLGVDATNDEAVARLYALKGRPAGKPMHVIVADMDMAEAYVEVTPLARELAARFLPGPLTIVLESMGTVSPVLEYAGTLGIRIPQHDFCLALARAFGKPYTATSANRSGKMGAYSVEYALASLGGAADGIGCVVDGGPLPFGPSSTVVDARGASPLLIREGALDPALREAGYL